MSDETKQGLTAALALIGTGAAPAAEPAGEQAGLFDQDATDAPMPFKPVDRTGRPGRPAGAKNRRTEEWVQYLLSRYRSPLVMLLEMASRSPKDLARELELYVYHEGIAIRDVTGEPVLATGEAFKAQVAAAIAALPYLHQKLPLAIDVKTPERGLLVIGELNVNAGEQGLALPLAPIEQNQRVIDATAVQSDGEQSDDDAKSRK